MAGLNLATELRCPLIELLEPAARALLLDPAAAPTDKMLDSLRGIFMAYELLVLTLSKSSTPKYAFRDLPVAERELYLSCEHMLGVLDRLHRPPVADPAEPARLP